MCYGMYVGKYGSTTRTNIYLIQVNLMLLGKGETVKKPNANLSKGAANAVSLKAC